MKTLTTVAMIALACSAAAAAGDDREKKLIEVLKSDAPPQEKAITCKQLVLCGTKEAVPALAPLLGDEKLASWARIALEAIPDPAADAALREAMGKVKGRLLTGVVNSIGVRRDAAATDGLVKVLKGDEAEPACAAAEALGRIGGPAAVQALEPALANPAMAVRSSAAWGLVLCAEKLMAEGKSEEAAKLYDQVRKAEVPKQRVLEGTRGAILARKSAGIPLLLELLKSTDKALFGIGLSTARELPGGDVTEALVAELPRMGPERQALMILALSDRGDPKALPALLEAIQSGPRETGLAAMGVMDRIGNVSCVPVLLKKAVDDDKPVAAAAKATLMRLPGAEVDADLLARLPKASGKERQVLIELAGGRRIEAALPTLLPFAEDADAGVRAAAVAALATLGGGKQVPDLVRILLKTRDAAERDTLEKALTATAARGGAACTADLKPLAQADDSALRVIALHGLACCGGPEALASVKAALDDKDEAVQDDAVRTLSTWPNRWPEDAAAAETLLALAKSGKKPTHRILALRGCLQYLQGNPKLGDEARLARVAEVLPLATRPEEKRLAIPVLGSIPSARALEMLVPLAEDPATAEEACSAIVSVAERKEMKGAPAEARRKALTVASEKTKNGGTRKKAQDLLKTVP